MAEDGGATIGCPILAPLFKGAVSEAD